jgi:hypothetical protein
MSAPPVQPLAPTWDALRAPLRAALGDDYFGRWFAQVTSRVEQKDGVWVLVVIAPNAFQRDWLANNNDSHVEALWRRLAPGGRVVFEAAPPAVARPPEVLPPAPPTAKVIQFPLFPTDTRPVANDMARSALFSCVQGKDRQMLDDVLLATVEGVEIRFTGKQLNQDDHDLLMQLVFMAQSKPLGDAVEVPARVILKALGRKTGGEQHRQLCADMTRLVAATIRLSSARYDYIGHLVDEAGQDKASRYWVYKFNPKLRALYDPSAYTLIDWEDRKKLRGKDLARWLQLYLASHAAPFPVKVETLRELSGSQATLKEFRRRLRHALDDLQERHIITAWKIDEHDLVHIDRGATVSASQRRHLGRAKPRKEAKK